MNKLNNVILRPYNFFVATFNQEGTAEPYLVSIDHNTFPVFPEFTISSAGSGRYFIDIININELDISENDSVAVNAEINYCSSGQTNKIEAFLSESHQTITILNTLLEFSSTQDIEGQFVVYLYKYF